MGMFTTIIHPESGEDIQIKMGHSDNMEVFKIGDRVVDVDGVYEGAGEWDAETREITYWWVVIKDSRAIAIEPMSENGNILLNRRPSAIRCYPLKSSEDHDTQVSPLEAYYEERKALLDKYF